MYAIHHRDLAGITSAMRRFTFKRDAVIEAAKARLSEIRTEETRLGTVITETLTKYKLANDEAALKRLDRMSPYYMSVPPELRDLITQRSIARSLGSVREELETFVTLATRGDCLRIGLMAAVGVDEIDLNGDEAKFMLYPFDAAKFAAALVPADDGVPMPMGVGTALAAHAHAPMRPMVPIEPLGVDSLGLDDSYGAAY